MMEEKTLAVSGIPGQSSVPLFRSYLGPLLCSAAGEGDLEALKEMVEGRGIDPSMPDYDGRTALHLASENGRVEIVNYLLSKGANVQATDKWGSTPLRGAISNGRKDIVQILKDQGASLRFTPSSSSSSPSSSSSFHSKFNLDTDLKGEERTEELLELFRNMGGGPTESIGGSEGNLPAPTKDNDKDKLMINSKKIGRYLRDKYGLSPKNSFDLREQLNSVSDTKGDVSSDKFLDLMSGPGSLLQQALDHRVVVPEWNSFCAQVRELFESVRNDVPSTDGCRAQYIPELAEVDPDLFGLCIVTVDGQVMKLGDFETQFSMQSCHKPLTYSLCAEELGLDYVHRYVGREPSGVAFNAFTLNKDHKPHNPLINAGAILCCSMYKHTLNLSKRFRSLTTSMVQLAGGDRIGFSQSVYLSEKNCAHRNFALAHFMAAEGAYPEHVRDILEAVDFYLQACSCEVNCQTLANIAACYANNGRSPVSGKRCLSFETVKNTLQLMSSCGMYDYSGEWACTVGLPAKSGVAGSIFVVIPDVLGLCVFSPPLDRQGNSTRGVEFCKRFAQKFNWSVLDVLLSKHEDNNRNPSSL